MQFKLVDMPDDRRVMHAQRLIAALTWPKRAHAAVRISVPPNSDAWSPRFCTQRVAWPVLSANCNTDMAVIEERRALSRQMENADAELVLAAIATTIASATAA